MDNQDRTEIAAALAGMHNLFTMLVRRLAYTEHVDMAELLIDLDALMTAPGLHPMTVAVQEDARECLLGALPTHAADPQHRPQAVVQADLQNVAPLRRSPGFRLDSKDQHADGGEPPPGDPALSLQERLQVLEIVVEEALWGPYLDDPQHRRAVADALNTRLEAAQRHSTFPPGVQAELRRYADSLAELDNTPEPLRPALRGLLSQLAQKRGAEDRS